MLLPPHRLHHDRDRLRLPVRRRLRGGAVDDPGDGRVALGARIHPHHRLPAHGAPLPLPPRVPQVKSDPQF